MEDVRRFSPATLGALADVITGGAANETTPPVGIYRSGPQLERFFADLNIELTIGSSSRVPAVREVLSNLNRASPDELAAVAEAASDPRDFLDDADKHKAVIEYLNKRLRYDGLELRETSQGCKLVVLSTGVLAAASLDEAISGTDFESVRADFDRALREAEEDPEDAITAACSTVESVCKCLLDEMEEPYPKKPDIRGLSLEVAKHLALHPGRADLDTQIAVDVRQILGGLASVAGGIGALRTHGGDAHGRGKRSPRVDARIARLAVHAASTLALFLIETWDKRAKQA
jgi:Abortive infection C-terminus